MPNLKNQEAWTYKPNTSSSLVAPSGTNVTVTAVSFTDTKKQYAASSRFDGETVHVKLLKWGMTKDNRLKPSAMSSSVALSGPVTSSQAVNIEIAAVDNTDLGLAYQPFLSLAGSGGPYFAYPIFPVPAKFTRENTAMDVALNIKIPRRPYTGLKDEFYTAALASDTAQAYGVTADYLDFGWGDDALEINYNVENYDWNTNGSKTTVPYTGEISAKFSLNPNTISIP